MQCAGDDGGDAFDAVAFRGVVDDAVRDLKRQGAAGGATDRVKFGGVAADRGRVLAGLSWVSRCEVQGSIEQHLPICTPSRYPQVEWAPCAPEQDGSRH